MSKGSHLSSFSTTAQVQAWWGFCPDCHPAPFLQSHYSPRVLHRVQTWMNYAPAKLIQASTWLFEEAVSKHSKSSSLDPVKVSQPLGLYPQWSISIHPSRKMGRALLIRQETPQPPFHLTAQQRLGFSLLSPQTSRPFTSSVKPSIVPTLINTSLNFFAECYLHILTSFSKDPYPKQPSQVKAAVSHLAWGPVGIW